jgi:hypothetical protein
MGVLGITEAKLRAKAEKAVGPKAVKVLEGAWKWIKALLTRGLGGIWEEIKDQLSNLYSMVIGGISKWITTEIVEAGVAKLIKMSNPVGAIIEAIQTIYKTLTFLVQKANEILALVDSVLNSIQKIVAGDIGSAAAWIENSLARAVPTVIAFLAKWMGFSDPGPKVREIVVGIQAKVEGALDWLVDKAIATVQKLFGTGEKDDNGKNGAATQISVDIPFEMDGEGHHLTAEIGPEGLQVRMASRADYLRILITGAETELRNRGDKSKIFAKLQRLDDKLKDLEETRIASGDIGGAEGEAVRSRITNRMTEISQSLAALGRDFGLKDLENLKHPSIYVGFKIGDNKYCLLDTTGKRKRFYPGYRISKDEWVKKQKIADGRPGEWLDRIDGEWYPDSEEATIDHKTAVAKHWNRERGRDMTQKNRADWYNDTDNFQLATRKNNTDERAKGEADMFDHVGLQFLGPNES